MNKIKEYRSLLLQSDADAFLLTSQLNRRYAAGYNISDGIAMIAAGECCYFTDSRYTEAAQRNLAEFTVIPVDRTTTYLDRIREYLERNHVRKLGFEESSMTASEYLSYREKLSVELVPMQKEISSLRMVKEPWELDAIRDAQRIAEEAFTDVLSLIRPGMTEKELRAELAGLLFKKGGDALSFGPIVVAGPNTSMPHGIAGDRPMQPGDFVTMDFGCKRKGYCSDMTRTVAIGFVTEEMERVYNTVLQAQLAGIAATKAGVCGCDVDKAARRVIEEAGFGEFFGHGYGHGIGLAVHEAPNCNASWKDPLPVGCVCSAEPGIYLPGKFGVRIEDMVFVTENGVINLTSSPKNLIIV